MIKRYIELRSFLESFQDDPKLADYLSTPHGNNNIQTLEDNLKNLCLVTTVLQREELDLCDVRVLFEKILSIKISSHSLPTF